MKVDPLYSMVQRDPSKSCIHIFFYVLRVFLFNFSVCQISLGAEFSLMCTSICRCMFINVHLTSLKEFVINTFNFFLFYSFGYDYGHFHSTEVMDKKSKMLYCNSLSHAVLTSHDWYVLLWVCSRISFPDHC